MEATAGTFILGGSSGYIGKDNYLLGSANIQYMPQRAAAKAIEIGTKMTEIVGNLCSGMLNLQYITIPNGVTSLGSNSFGSTSSLKALIIPRTITTFSASVYAGLWDPIVSLPPILSTLPNYAFDSTRITDIVLPESLRIIGQWAFRYSYCLKSITIPSGVTSMQSGTFSYSAAYNEIHFLRSTPPTLSSSSCLPDANSTGETFFIYVPTGSLASYQAATYFSNRSSEIVEE